jgi:hypothetical protein
MLACTSSFSCFPTINAAEALDKTIISPSESYNQTSMHACMHVFENSTMVHRSNIISFLKVLTRLF